MKHPAFLIVLVLLAIAGPVSAELYKYTDAKGELHFVDDISKVPKKYRKQLENAESQGNANFMDAAPASRPSQERTEQEPQERRSVSSPSANVEVFMTSWCGYCRKMIRFLNEKGIPYTAYDIEKDSTAARAYKELGGKGVPVVRVGSHVVHGYSPEAVMSYLKERK
jgi:glutaredoxin